MLTASSTPLSRRTSVSLTPATSRPQGSIDRFAALDGWRGLGALVVMTFHLSFCLRLPHWHLEKTVTGGYTLVDFFFVLSGFVVAHTHPGRITSRRDALQAFVRRVGRTWPLHALVLAIFVTIELTRWGLHAHGLALSGREAFSGATSVGSMVAHFFLIQAMTMPDTYSWNIPSWSLSVELWVYGLYTLLSLWRSPKARWVPHVVAVVSLTTLLLAVPTTEDATFRWGIFRSLLGFSLGLLAHRLWSERNQDRSRPSERAAARREILLLAAAFGLMTFARYAYLSFIAAPFYMLVVMVFADGRGPVSRLFRQPIFLLLGKWSFSIYVIHYLFIHCINSALPLAARFFAPRGLDLATSQSPETFREWLPFLVASVLVVGLTLALAPLTRRYVEQPAARAFDKIAKKLSVSPASTPEATSAEPPHSGRGAA